MAFVIRPIRSPHVMSEDLTFWRRAFLTPIYFNLLGGRKALRQKYTVSQKRVV